jgi:methylated-DNA-[protein]-cysteine S-methyltransferase
MKMMKDYERDLISVLLGDTAASPELKRWLRTEAGRKARADYRETLHTLQHGLSDRTLENAATPIYYAAIDSPVGRVLVAVSTAGVARLAFGRNDSAFVRQLRQQLHAEVERSSTRLGAILEQLDAYFAGKRRSFAVPIDAQLMTPFQQRVLDAAQKIPAGQSASYGDIARAIGQPKASRAVGQALGHNPIPIIIPCHRVVASDGGLGGYTGGLAIKRKLLALEGRRI